MKNSFNPHALGRQISLDYSRHFCNDSRMASAKRPSRSFSDTVAIEFIRRRALQRSSEFHERDPKFANSASTERICQQQVYNKDQSFLNKYGNKKLRTETHGLPETESPGRTSSSCKNSAVRSRTSNDDETRSCCESVSSIISSNFANPDAKRERKSRPGGLPDKKAKFDSITTWLENLPRPVL